MALIKKPVTGMKDILPKEMQIREYVLNTIKESYGQFGFTQIETPCVENIENLTNKQGGENEKLIFKIMKRGDKLNLEKAKDPQDLVDGGLRYDLTVPLSRFYANHENELPSPFKALQIGSVWRADRPQKGRFRQFVQCDIDILGESRNIAEIELILATSSALSKLGFENFKVRINERRILKAMATYAGFESKDFDLVFIILDKMDKIGFEGVEKELIASGFSNDSVHKYITLYQQLELQKQPLVYLKDLLNKELEEDVVDSLSTIIDAVDNAKVGRFDLLFDPTLVRGMSYYTGTIFEIEMPEFGSSVAGGGRYDEMIGKFTGKNTPACGFSIGFERIVTILLDQNFEIPSQKNRCAYLVDKTVSSDQLIRIIEQAQGQRAQGNCVLLVTMNKNKKFQKEQLQKEGYLEFVEFYADHFEE